MMRSSSLVFRDTFVPFELSQLITDMQAVLKGSRQGISVMIQAVGRVREYGSMQDFFEPTDGGPMDATAGHALLISLLEGRFHQLGGYHEWTPSLFCVYATV